MAPIAAAVTPATNASHGIVTAAHALRATRDLSRHHEAREFFPAASTHAPLGRFTQNREQNLDAVGVLGSRGVCLQSPASSYFKINASALAGNAQQTLMWLVVDAGSSQETRLSIRR